MKSCPSGKPNPIAVLVELERGHVEEYVFFEGIRLSKTSGRGLYSRISGKGARGRRSEAAARVLYGGNGNSGAGVFLGDGDGKSAQRKDVDDHPPRRDREACAGFCGEGYTEKEAYNLTAYALENGAYNRTASLQAPYKYGAACAFAAWTAELNGGETATLEIRSRLWTTREEGTKKTVYTLEYRAGNIGGVAQKTLALQSELFIAETSGAELLETLSPAELSAGENVPVKDLHGRGRYALTENSASFYLYEKAKIASFAENRLFWPAVFFCLAACSVALFVVASSGAGKPFEGPKRPSDE